MLQVLEIILISTLAFLRYCDVLTLIMNSNGAFINTILLLFFVSVTYATLENITTKHKYFVSSVHVIIAKIVLNMVILFSR